MLLIKEMENIMTQKTLSFLLLPVIVLTIFFSQKPAHAADITVGAASWYCWWGYKPEHGNGGFKPGLLYGPVAGYDFGNDWSVSSIFLTGPLSEKDDSGNYNQRRYDSDTVLSYKLTRWLKIFGGYKYFRMGFNHDKPTPGLFKSTDEDYVSKGAGLGAGLTLPATESLFVLANFSGLYCFGRQKNLDTTRDTGFNSNVSLAYYLSSLSTTLSGGFRYQYLDSKHKTYTNQNTKAKFYGFTLMAMYHISLDDEK
jgi:hypothetical protein